MGRGLKREPLPTHPLLLIRSRQLKRKKPKRESKIMNGLNSMFHNLFKENLNLNQFRREFAASEIERCNGLLSELDEATEAEENYRKYFELINEKKTKTKKKE